MADHTGSAAIGNDLGADRGREAKQLAYLVVARRVRDAVGEGADAAGTQRDPVAQALAAGVAQAILGVGHDQRMGR